MIEVLVAAYQGRKYLREQLDSIMNQTVKGLQVLISDDGSTDGSWEIIEEYIRKYPGQIRGIRHERDGKTSLNPAAANFFWLLSQATGDYVLLSDQDDVWKEQKVECMMEDMTAMEAEWGMETPLLLHSDAVVVDKDLTEIAPSFFAYQQIGAHRTQLEQILVENPVTGAAVMINQALLVLSRKAPEQCVMHDWWIALTAACFGRIQWMKEPLYYYRQHDNNTLGARKTGSVKDLYRRMSRGNRVRENYHQMFEQASCFLEHYHESISREEEEMLQAFLTLPYQGPAGRFHLVCRYHFYKSSRLQTLAQCLTMPGRMEER